MRHGRPKVSLRLGIAALFGLFVLTTVDSTRAAGEDRPRVVIDTSMGAITLELDRAKAPTSVENFLKYVDSGYYNGTIFHRVIPDFMIQGGGFNDQMKEKDEGLLPPIRNEGSNGLSNKRGTIAMARTGDPNSATSQFFINRVDNSNRLDAAPGSAGYAVFGAVIDGMDVVDKIAEVPTNRRDAPLKPVHIRSIRRKGK